MAKFTITTCPNNNSVDISVTDDKEFIDWMMACSFLLHKTAQLSEAGYEKAQELLCKGAMDYKITTEIY